MKRFIYNPEFPHRPASSRVVNMLLGLRDGQKLPVEGMPPREIQGVKVWVTPLPPHPDKDKPRGLFGSMWKRSTHRVLCECPDCGKVLSIGRLAQHVCKSHKGE